MTIRTQGESNYNINQTYDTILSFINNTTDDKNDNNNNYCCSNKIKNTIKTIDYHGHEVNDPDHTREMQRMKRAAVKSTQTIKGLRKQIEKLEETIRILQHSLSEKEKHIEDLFSDDKKCVICMVNPKDYAYTGCGHMCVCGDCVGRWSNQCPLCRAPGAFMQIIS